jgi:hypothetical protein
MRRKDVKDGKDVKEVKDEGSEARSNEVRTKKRRER